MSSPLEEWTPTCTKARSTGPLSPLRPTGRLVFKGLCFPTYYQHETLKCYLRAIERAWRGWLRISTDIDHILIIVILCHNMIGSKINICHMPCRFQINGQESGWCSQGCQSIVDTGTSMLTAPSQFLSSIMQAIGAQQNQYGSVRPMDIHIYKYTNLKQSESKPELFFLIKIQHCPYGAITNSWGQVHKTYAYIKKGEAGRKWNNKPEYLSLSSCISLLSRSPVCGGLQPDQQLANSQLCYQRCYLPSASFCLHHSGKLVHACLA